MRNNLVAGGGLVVGGITAPVSIALPIPRFKGPIKMVKPNLNGGVTVYNDLALSAQPIGNL